MGEERDERRTHHDTPVPSRPVQRNEGRTPFQCRPASPYVEVKSEKSEASHPNVLRGGAAMDDSSAISLHDDGQDDYGEDDNRQRSFEDYDEDDTRHRSFEDYDVEIRDSQEPETTQREESSLHARA
ncbi:hypothetical protein BGZ65_006916, partial [Modicella reniformis]